MMHLFLDKCVVCSHIFVGACIFYEFYYFGSCLSGCMCILKLDLQPASRCIVESSIASPKNMLIAATADTEMSVQLFSHSPCLMYVFVYACQCFMGYYPVGSSPAGG